MRNIIITGGAGFLGSNFAHYIYNNRKNINIIIYDKLTYASNIDNLIGVEHTFIKGDICDIGMLQKTIEEYNIDTIVHFAAETHVDNSIDSPAVFIDTNIKGTYNILEVCRQYDLRLHHTSTDEVFGDLPLDRKDLSFNENTPYNPSSPYSASKAASDHLVRAWIRTYNIKATISNCSNIYGIRQFTEKLIPRQITNAILNKDLILYGEGVNVRDWIWADDHSDAILTILEKGAIGETYLIGARNEKSNKEILEEICYYFPFANIKKVKDRLGHDLRYAIDPSKIEKELNWEPKYTNFNENIKTLVKWYKHNRSFWDKGGNDENKV